MYRREVSSDHTQDVQIHGNVATSDQVGRLRASRSATWDAEDPCLLALRSPPSALVVVRHDMDSYPPPPAQSLNREKSAYFGGGRERPFTGILRN